MNENWDRYEPYRLPYLGPLAQLPRREAQESFASWVEARPERWEQLRRLLGDEVHLGDGDAELQSLNDWFRESVEAKLDKPERLSNRWYAVVNDVAVVLGDILIRRCPGLSWEFFTKGGKSDVAYQKHVIVGFTKVPNAKFNLDVDRLVATYAHQIAAGVPVPEDYFVEILAAGQARA